jgi:hypothetical protein
MFQLFGAGLLKTENLAAWWCPISVLGQDPQPCGLTPDMPDGVILAGRVHSLENQQQCITVGCIVKALQRVQLPNVSFYEFLISSLRLVKGPHNRRPLFELEFVSGQNTETVGIDSPFHPV